MIRLQDFVVNRLPEDERELAAARMGERMDDYGQMDAQTPTPPGDEAEAVHNASEEANEPPHQSGRALSSPIPQPTKRSSVPTNAGMSARPVDDGLVPSESEVENARWRDGLGVWGNMIAGAIRGAAGMRTDAPETPHEAQDLAVERRRGLLERARQAREQEENGRNFSYRAKRDAIGDANNERNFLSAESRRQADDDRMAGREASLNAYRNAQLELAQQRNDLTGQRLTRRHGSGSGHSGSPNARVLRNGGVLWNGESTGDPIFDELIAQAQQPGVGGRPALTRGQIQGILSGPNGRSALAQTVNREETATTNSDARGNAADASREIIPGVMSDVALSPQERTNLRNGVGALRSAFQSLDELDRIRSQTSAIDAINPNFRSEMEARMSLIISSLQKAKDAGVLNAGEYEVAMRTLSNPASIMQRLPGGERLSGALRQTLEMGTMNSTFARVQNPEAQQALRDWVSGRGRAPARARQQPTQSGGSPQQGGQRVRVRRPDGSEGMIPAANVERARARGWTILE